MSFDLPPVFFIMIPSELEEHDIFIQRMIMTMIKRVWTKYRKKY
jgi:hypothetical protein